MKKRINIVVNPADNGYTITANVSDVNGQNQKSVNLIAMDDKGVQTHVQTFMHTAFTDSPAAKPLP